MMNGMGTINAAVQLTSTEAEIRYQVAEAERLEEKCDQNQEALESSIQKVSGRMQK